jgi:hypothetical protein
MSIRVVPPMPTRPCGFCLSLQDDSVFADFDIAEDGRVVLRRISFDGFGCYGSPGDIGRMDLGQSRTLTNSLARDAVHDSQVELALRTYFRENSAFISTEALSAHELL